MKKSKIKIPAKINLSLDVLGVTGNFHDIKSLVTSVDVYDQITAQKRTDKRITLKVEGNPIDCHVVDNNAYKAGKLFVQKTGVLGANITIKKQIPIGGGLGGSSADIAGVLLCMEELYQTGANLNELAGALGSDAPYMLTGGYAVIEGRGEKVTKKQIDTVLYLILIPEEKSTSARAVYKEYDKAGKTYKPCTENVEKALKEGELAKFVQYAKNDLAQSAGTLVPEITANVLALKKAGAITALVTGSGSCCYGVFCSKKERDNAFRKLKALYGNVLIKAQTLPCGVQKPN